ncbi:3-coathanger stack domain-containing protein [uncultured Psychroserpens sp.]|uniref:3-coathanger stack domain-containing protein n=1 Tax=uncultured Psychroserpens sp. TaxID=255436 RepID=UPI00262C49F2|nr:3-coathanger stack domain-containing protein [uncultured Psychroserpens sp.]
MKLKRKIKTIGVLIISLIFSFSMWAQDRINKKTVVDLFEVDKNSSLRDKYITDDIDGEILSLNQQKLLELINSDLNSFVLKVPVQDRIIELNLKRSNFIVDGAKGKTTHSKFETKLMGRGAHFWGHVEDDKYSGAIIAFSFYKDQVYGFLSSQYGNYSLHKLNEKSDNYAFYKYKEEVNDFECATDTNGFPKKDSNAFQLENSNVSQSALDYPLEISMNANNCVINNPFMGNGSITHSIDYILSHFNLYSLIFANEEVSIKISEIVLEDSVPNGTGQEVCLFGVNASTDFYGPGMTFSGGNCPPSGTTHYLQQFQDILGNSYVGDYAYMYVGSSCRASGRAATIGAFCNAPKTSRMGVGLAPNALLDDHPLPDYFHRLNIFPHEIGHLLGAVHTFCSSTPYYNIMLSGGGSCFDVDKDFRRGFGVARGNTIRNNILNNMTCFNESNSCEQDDLYIFHRIEDLGSVDYAAFYKATNIVADNLILNNSEALYTAEAAIELIPGFEVEENSEFEARIEACNNGASRIGVDPISNNDVSGIAILISPTAIEDIVNVENKSIEGVEMSSIKVYNLIGTEVFKLNGIKERKANLDLSHLSKGFYVVKISATNGNVLHTQKIIKK